MALFKKKKDSNDGSWVPVEQAQSENLKPGGPRGVADMVSTGGKDIRDAKGKQRKVFKVLTYRGRQERAWLDSGLWQPLQETVIPAEAKAPLTTVHYGTYGSDGMRNDGPPGGSYSSVFNQYAMQGGDLYTRDEVRHLKQWDTRKPFPGFDPKLGSKTLDIYSED